MHLHRLVKEVAYYQQEVKENEAKLQTMKDKGKDPYDIKKFDEVLGESLMMIPDSKRRLKESLEDLGLFLDTTETLTDGEYLTKARNLLQKGPQEQTLEETQVEDDAEAF
jgi:tubulin-specific chaperone A